MKFQEACAKVAQEYRDNAIAMRVEDPYADHVDEITKDLRLKQELDLADRVEQGVIESFSTAQRVNYHMTGETVPFLF